MSNQIQTTGDDKPMSFVPYGSADAIKLSVSIIQNIIAVPTKSGKTCSKRDAMKFMMMCQARRLNPFEGDAFLIGYDGQNGPEFSLITAHQAFLKRAEIHPEFDGMTSGIIVLDDEETGALSNIEGDFHLPGQRVVGGWATVHLKTRKHPVNRRIRMERFNKGFAQWKQDPAGMICKCAEADALRSAFPTMLGGLYMQDEAVFDVKARPVDIAEVSRLVEFKSHEPEKSAEKSEDDRAESAAGLAPETPENKPEPKREPVPPLIDWQSELSEVWAAMGPGCDFGLFVLWCGESGSLPDSDSITGWIDVKKADCERLLRSLRGAKSRISILANIETLKGRLV